MLFAILHPIGAAIESERVSNIEIVPGGTGREHQSAAGVQGYGTSAQCGDDFITPIAEADGSSANCSSAGVSVGHVQVNRAVPNLLHQRGPASNSARTTKRVGRC